MEKLNVVQRFLIFLISKYQATISPDHSRIGHSLFPGGFCKFAPSCSSYTMLAIKKYGAIKGSIKSVWRILRCNPFTQGGKDMP